MSSDLTRREFLKAAGAGTAAAAVPSLLRADDPRTALPVRTLGKTGVTVPVLGLGTAPAGQRPRKEAAAFYAAAMDKGVTYLDTAPDFTGYGVAQKALGDVLADPARREAAFLVTKCFEPDGEKALALLRSNLDELRVERADLVYVHSLGDDKMDPKVVFGPSGVGPALRKAQRDGLCRFVGVSGHSRPERFLAALDDFGPDVMMNAVNPVVRHVYGFETKVWPQARERNVGLVAMKVLGGIHRRPTDPASRPEAKGGRIRERTCDCFRYALSLEGVSLAVLGCFDEQELDKAIGWANSFRPLAEEERRDLIAWGQSQAKEWGHVYGPVA
ncbi:MAG TPA: aldo/keto reductase [Planctomycetaceae bacterium]